MGAPVRCGEAVGEEVVKDFGMKIDESCIRTKVNRAKFQSSTGKTFDITTKNHGLILNRTNFEQLIIDNARSSGAELAMRTNVTGLSKSGVKIGSTNVKSKIIIGADGIESMIGYYKGINTTLALKDVGICAQYVVSNFDIPDNQVEMYWGEKYTEGGGYIWVFSRGDGSANLGIGVTGTQMPRTGLKKLLEKFIKTRCGSKYKLSNFHAGSIPQSLPIPTTVSQNVMLVGDAARLAIPLTGAGIGHALITGKMAAGTIIEMEETGSELDYLQKYDADWRPIISKKLKRAYKMKERFVADPAAIDRIFRMLMPLAALHKLFPNFIEKVALRNFRY